MHRVNTEKKKYFKIEKSHAVPAGGAAWSADSVKKRRLEDEEAARALRRMSLDRRRVSRARVLGHCLTGGFLDRELFGGGSSSSSAGLRKGPGDLREAAFAAALEPRGKLPLKDARWTSHANVNHLYVDGQDRNTDMCVAFASKFSF
ncbi:hypothetical protein SLS62_002215 [Diatrype stigma]|uniref:Uncharacterized protein n=1 Tax=Diatrype stigma TaxID=117547 RepID=A0AAN9YR66_9PEZI